MYACLYVYFAGISSLFNGDMDTAETYLQLAARWAQPEQYELQISALSNLGAYIHYISFYCSARSSILNVDVPVS